MKYSGIDFTIQRNFLFHLKDKDNGFVTVRYYKRYKAIKFVRKEKKIFIKGKNVKINVDLTDCPKTKRKELKEFRSYDYGAWSVSERESSYTKEVDLIELCPIYMAKSCNYTMLFNKLNKEHVFRAEDLKKNKQNILYV